MTEEKKSSIISRFGEKQTTKWYDSSNNIKLTLINHPEGDFRRRCYDMIKATWLDEPITGKDANEEDVKKTFKELLQFKVLPNSMEHLQFTFLIEGLTLVEVTHLLRHRMLSSIHAQCTGDRFLQTDSAFIPWSVDKSEFADEYKELTEKCKDLYERMISSRKISILDARYILTRNHRYFYYITINLKEAISFIEQRKCTQIQPELDNIIAHEMFHKIAKIIPELWDTLKLNCSPNCFYIKSQASDNSRVYLPDKNHKQYLKDEKISTLYNKTRKEMGILFNPQDE